VASAFGPPDNHVAAADSRVCPSTAGNNVPLSEVISHFALALPPGASHVRFTANVNPLFGEYSLDLRFRTTRAGLRAFLSRAGLRQASPDMRTTDMFGVTACGLTPPRNEQMAYSQDSATGPNSADPRAVAVDLSDLDFPVVWVTDQDL
jgi:hypothetical protein